MPTYTIDDRKAIAEIAAKHGWIAQVTTQDFPEAHAKEARTVYRVLFTSPTSHVEITCLYNALDRLTHAALWNTDDPPAKHSCRVATVKEWFVVHGGPTFDLVNSGGRIRLLRNGDLLAEAIPDSFGGGRWFIHSEVHGGNVAMLGGDTVSPEEARALAITVLKSLGGSN